MSDIAAIRHRIKVVEETRKITNAMYLIASSKMKRAVRLHELDQAYFQHVRQSIRFLLDNAAEIHHPFFHTWEGSRTAYLVIAADKGLCGAYNQNVLRLADAHMQGKDTRSIFTVGHMAREHFQRMDIEPDVDYLHVIQRPSLDDARGIAQTFCDLYRENHIDEVNVAFTQMESVVKQTPRVMRLLPVLREDFQDVEPLHAPTGELTFHPSTRQVLDLLVPQYIIGLVYGMLIESFASEQCARMTSMESSTRNADEMLGKLRLEHNRARQAQITQELSEIVGGASAQ